MDDWDGNERRAAAVAAEAVKGNGTIVQVPVVALIIGFVSLALLQFGSLIGHKILSDHQDDEAGKNQSFRQSITCYVVEITKGRETGEESDPLDLLTRCGLLGGLPNGVPEVNR